MKHFLEGLQGSVVIPVLNRADLLRSALEGLAAQTFSTSDFEVLICDDGSTDDLSLVIDCFRPRLPNIRHLKQSNQGPAAARNLGIVHSISDIVVFLDSDVVPGPAAVGALIAALRSHDAWEGAEAKLLPTGGEESLAWDAPRCDGGGRYHTAGIAYRKSVLEKVGGLDENFSRAACEDIELAVQVLRHGPIGFVPEAVVYHPRRRRTVASCWKNRKNWRYVQMLARRYGILAWPGNKTAWPRLRTAICAVATLPAGRSIDAILCLPHSPHHALLGFVFAIVDWLGGLAMLPVILFAPLPARRSRLVNTGSAMEHRK